jgi:hypothetical protein
MICCFDYFQEKKCSQCDIYGYPYKLKYDNDITNHFSGGIFKYVSEVQLFDQRSIQYEFFSPHCSIISVIEKIKFN